MNFLRSFFKKQGSKKPCFPSIGFCLFQDDQRREFAVLFTDVEDDLTVSDFIFRSVVIVYGVAFVDDKDLFFILMPVKSDPAVLFQKHLGKQSSLFVKIFLAADICDDDLARTFPHRFSDFHRSVFVSDDHNCHSFDPMISFII